MSGDCHLTVQLSKKASAGLRVRLLAIILILIGPLAALQAVELLQVRATRTQITLDRAYELAKAGAARYQDTIDDVRTVLDLLSRVPDVTNGSPEVCARFLTGVAASHQWARSLSLIGNNQKVFCSTNPDAVAFDVSDLGWFQSARKTGGFSVSGFFVNRVSKMPTTFAALFYRNGLTGETQTLLANLDLAWFDRLAATVGGKQDALVLLIDSGGVILSRYPAGQIPGNARVSPQFFSDISAPKDGVFAAMDPDGNERLFGSIALPEARAHVVVGFDRAATLGLIDKFIWIAAFIFVGTMLFGGFIVWVIGDRIFVRPIEELNGLLRTTLDTMDQGLIAIDRQGRSTIMNARVLELLDLPREFAATRPRKSEILKYQRSIGEFSNEEKIAQIGRDIDERRHTIYERERPNGTVLEIRTVPTADGGFVRTYSDITARRAIEAALRREKARAETAARALEQANRQFKVALSNMPDGFCMFDKDQRLVISNSRYREMYGLTPDQVKPGISLRQILEFHLANGESSELDIDEYIKVIVQQTTQTHVLADGRTVAMRRQPMSGGGWIAIHEDITDQKRIEAALRHEKDRAEAAARALEQTNMRFDVALSNMSNGVCMFDADQKLVISNVRFREMYGLKEDQIKPGMPLKEFLERYATNSMGNEPDIDSYIQVVLTQSTQTLLLADGRTVLIRRKTLPEGGWIATHEDITDQKRIEAALRHERDRAEASARATADFLTSMSHELRTPLTAIIGVSDMLLNGPQSPDRQRQFMELQRKAGQGLLSVINDILDFSKIEAGQLDLEAVPLCLREIAEDCFRLVTDQAQRKGLKLTAAIAINVPDWVVGDPTRLRHVLLNLVANGVKFTNSGSVALTIEGVPEGTHAIHFAVADTGIGIKPENMANLFERFAQADSSTTRRFGGTGLGLAISKRLVTLMGGDMEVESELGRGSTFSFTLELPPGQEAEPEYRPELSQRGASYRLLLAEDNELNRQLIKAVLEQAGHEVVVVNDGAEAVRTAIRISFDAILMDVQMPEMNGYSATRAIRSATLDAPALPIIALTANALSDEAERCLEAGMNLHVPKPVDWPALFSAIDRSFLNTGKARAAKRIQWSIHGST